MVKGNIIVKYDMEVCGEYAGLEEAKTSIANHHFVDDDPNEAQYFEFFEVIGPASGCVHSIAGKPGAYDLKGNRYINGYAVKDLGFIFKDVNDIEPYKLNSYPDTESLFKNLGI